MIKYGIATTRFDLWFKVAQQFVKDNFAAPVFWLDTRHKDKEFKEVFPDCLSLSVFEYNNWCKGVFNAETLYCNNEVVLPDDWAEIKDIVKLIFNRYNLLGEWRNVDMDASIMNIAINLLRIWPKDRIDYFIFTETPHTPVDYMIYKICQKKKIPTLMLQQNNIVPVIMFKFDINGNCIKLRNNNFNPEIKNYFLNELENYFYNIQANDQHLKESLIALNKIDQKKSAYSYYFNRSIYTAKEIWGHYKGKRITRTVFQSYKSMEPGFWGPLLAQMKREAFRKKLKKKFLDIFDKDFPKGKYVFFPLHYEPERTTVPDGGKYYDQMKALVALRQKLDIQIPIFVKEHFLIFSKALRGETGRSPYFYDFVKGLPNTFLIDYRLNTRKLIKDSLFVASISGSVLYETVALGKPAIMLGYSWFQDAPGIYHFDDLSEINTEIKPVDPITMITHLKNKIINDSIPGAAHGSSLSSLKNHLGKTYSLDYEASLLSEALIEIFNETNI